MIPTLELDSARMTARLTSIENALVNPRPLMAAISQDLLGSVEDVMEAEGIPGWAGLSAARIAQRTKMGKWPGKMLQVSSAGLASANQPSSGDDFAQVSNNKVYARPLHFGAAKGAFGTSKRGRPIPWGNIPARPFMVITDEAEATILKRGSKWIMGDGA